MDLESAGGGGEFVDDAGVEFGVDRHLFTRHGVEGEARRDLGDTASALGDDDKIDDDENDENDSADDVVSLDEHMAEGFDDISGEAVEQDESRGGDVQRESQQCDRKENGGKGGELWRILHIDDHEQDHQRNADVHGEKEIQRPGWDGDDQQEDDAEEAEREDQICLLEQIAPLES